MLSWEFRVGSLELGCGVGLREEGGVGSMESSVESVVWSSEFGVGGWSWEFRVEILESVT